MHFHLSDKDFPFTSGGATDAVRDLLKCAMLRLCNFSSHLSFRTACHNCQAEAIFEAVCAVLRLLPQQPSPSSREYDDHNTCDRSVHE